RHALVGVWHGAACSRIDPLRPPSERLTDERPTDAAVGAGDQERLSCNLHTVLRRTTPPKSGRVTLHVVCASSRHVLRLERDVEVVVEVGVRQIRFSPLSHRDSSLVDGVSADSVPTHPLSAGFARSFRTTDVATPAVPPPAAIRPGGARGS